MREKIPKSIYFHAAMFLALVGVCGCASQSVQVKRALENYLEAVYAGRPEDAYGYVSKQDQAAKPLQDYQDETRTNRVIYSAIGQKISWKIKDVKVEKDRAHAGADIKFPTLDLLAKNAWDALKDKGEGLRQFLGMLADRLGRGDILSSTESKRFDMVREGGEWRINNHWAETRDRDAAVKAEQKAYLKNLSVLNVHSGGDATGGATVTGEIRNEGDKAVRNAQVTVYFLDAGGKPVQDASELIFPLSPFLSDSDDQVIKPGYVRKFTVKTDEIPSLWSGKVQVKVTDVKFSDAKTVS